MEPSGLTTAHTLSQREDTPARAPLARVCFPSALVCISCCFLLVLLIRKQKTRDKVNCREKGAQNNKDEDCVCRKGKGQRKGKRKERG